jgi:alpha-L-rhamnosidase
VNGKYLVYRCDRPVRVRIEQVRGDNAVISGVFFDPAPAT